MSVSAMETLELIAARQRQQIAEMKDKRAKQVIEDLQRETERQREQLDATRVRLDDVERRVAALVQRECDRTNEWSRLLDALPTDSPAAAIIRDHLNESE